MHGERYDIGELSLKEIEKERQKGDVKNGTDRSPSEVFRQNNARIEEQRVRDMLYSRTTK